MRNTIGASAFFSAVLALLFIVAAFKGFHFWYEGFVFFFWLSLASLNYRHRTTLWLGKNRARTFWRFYGVLVLVGLMGDFVIGLHVANLWSYPYYTSPFDWARLYLIIYPFGGLSILELSFFTGYVFHERFVFLPSVHRTISYTVDLFDQIVDYSLLLFLLGGSILYFFGLHLISAAAIVGLFLLWALLSTIKLALHLRHGTHWIAIFAAVLFVSILLHEVPNTAVFEWQYHSAPTLNMSIAAIPVWVVVGWYVMLLLMYRLWLRFVLNEANS